MLYALCSDAAITDIQSGIFPCLRHGRSTFLVRSTSRSLQRRGRVSAGSNTASMNPRCAATCKSKNILAGELQGDYTREGKKGAYHGVGESVGVLGGAAVRVLAAEDDLHRALTVVPEGVRYQY